MAEWMRSGEKVHTIRDHPNHDRPLNGGLWGGTKGCIPGGIAEHIRKFANKQGYGGDLQFLNTVVWPRVKNDQFGHDAYTCNKYPNSHPFPTKRPENYQHVGQVFDEHDRGRDIDVRQLRSTSQPDACKPGRPRSSRAALPRERECAKMKADHGVVVGASWGSLPPQKQARWNRLACDPIARG